MRALATLLISLAVLYPCAAAAGWEYAVIVDAGSSGSRVHVYKFFRHKDFPYATVDLPHAVHKVSPGLSSFAFDAKAGAKSLWPLLKFAKDKVPEQQWERTPLQLFATSGLRMLADDAAARLVQECRRSLGGSGFLFRDDWARIISGQEEGLFGWVAINYATGALQALAQQQQRKALGRAELPGGLEPIKPTAPLLGVLELGGGSLQVTFAVDERRRIPDSHAAPLQMPGLAGRQLYSHSFEGFGLQAALARHKEKLKGSGAKADPCLPAGFKADGGVAGGSDWDACKAAAAKLLPAGRCDFGSCSLGNVFTPPVEGPLIGIENFYYTARALRLNAGEVKLSDYEAAAKKFCSKSWAAIRKEFLKHSQGQDTYALQVCFAAAHVLSVLRNGLHIQGTAAMTLSNAVGTPKGQQFASTWTLGALMVEVLGTGGLGTAGSPLGSHAGAAKHAAGGAARMIPRAPASEAGAAAMAAAFCVALIALMAVASHMRVGIVAGPLPHLEKGRSGTPLPDVLVEMQGLLANVNGVPSGVQSAGASSGGALPAAALAHGATGVSAARPPPAAVPRPASAAPGARPGGGAPRRRADAA